MLNRRNFLLASVAGLALPRGASSVESPAQWGQGPALPIPVQEIYPAFHRGKIHVAGGFRAILGQVIGPTEKHYSLDPAKGAWEQQPPLPSRLHHPQLVSFANNLYCIGGFSSPAPTRIWLMSDRVWRFDEDASAWEPETSLPNPAGECMSGVLSDGLHLCGGRRPSTPSAGSWEDHRDTEMHIRRAKGSTAWENAAPLPSPRNSAASAVIADRLHVVGGRTVTDGNLDAHHIYDPQEDRWREAMPMPLAQAGLAAAAVNGRLYAFGGERFGERARVFAESWVYDPARDVWTSLPDMPNPRHGLGAVAVEDNIFVLGGALAVGGKRTTDIVDIFQP